MSLFQEIRKLCLTERNQLEDVLSEIVAAVLKNSPDLMVNWLKEIGASNFSEVDSFQVTTQERFFRLEKHDADSRIDLVIRLVSKGRNQIIYVESKVDSTQGNKQLQRYAEQLAQEWRDTPGEAPTLVYLTRNYEVVAKPGVPGFSFNFRQSRWFDFYRLLKARSSKDGLEKQLKQFMEENHMSTGNQFRASDLVALENFLTSKSLMDETLNVLSDHGDDQLGRFSHISRAIKELRLHHRYVRYIFFSDFQVLVGYWLPLENPDEPVRIGVVLFSNPNSSKRTNVIEAFKAWKTSQTEWESDDLDQKKEWVSIYKRRPLNTVLSAKDHVQEIKGYFSSLVREVSEFRHRFPNLSWANLPSPDSEAEDR